MDKSITYSDGVRRNQMDTDKLLLRPAEVANALGIGRSKTYVLLASGELPSIRVGSSLRVPVDALRAWIARQLKPGHVGP
jgi:excisionase family DNA binding protein